jgi:tetratricopeptide (TPR) repeat protein
MSQDSTESRQPLSPARRRILQQQFEHGSRMAAKGEFDYALNLFKQCVLGDPSNRLYAQQLLGTLYRKYNNNKKGGKFAALKAASVKKCQLQKDWQGVLAAGLEVLEANPWHSGALLAMAEACDQLGYDEAQLEYLGGALQVDVTDIEANRRLARVLERLGDFDRAIACWQRVQKANPQDEEAKRGLGDCQVKRTIDQGKYDTAETSREVAVDQSAERTMTLVEKLQRAIKRQPDELSNYLELADIFSREEKYDEAIELLTQALSVSGGAISVRERLEDAQLRKLREQVSIAEKRAAELRTEEAVTLYKKYKAELNNMELEVYRNRCERYPNQIGLKYELGIRLQRAGLIDEAIKALQEARNDPQRKGEVLLALGECFHAKKLFKLAMNHYEQALEEISDRKEELKKRAFYRAGKLALGLKDFDKAEKLLNELASRDYSYLDVAELLDKVRVQRQ